MRTQDLIPLTKETRLSLTTNEAALHLSLKPQTLRTWGQSDSAPLTPVNVNGRLYWLVRDLVCLLNNGRVLKNGVEK
jgi:hypothetical protein